MESQFFSLEGVAFDVSCNSRTFASTPSSSISNKKAREARSYRQRKTSPRTEQRSYSATYQRLRKERNVLRRKAAERLLNSKGADAKLLSADVGITVGRIPRRNSNTSQKSIVETDEQSTKHMRSQAVPPSLDGSVRTTLELNHNRGERLPINYTIRSNAATCIQAFIRRFLAKRLATQAKAACIINRLFRRLVVKSSHIERERRMAHLDKVISGIKRREAHRLEFRRPELLYTIYESAADSFEEDSKDERPWQSLIVISEE
eukprot:scaffold9345_cov120-Cylindrotheca_fusiformis.AAC.11